MSEQRKQRPRHLWLLAALIVGLPFAQLLSGNGRATCPPGVSCATSFDGAFCVTGDEP